MFGTIPAPLMNVNDSSGAADGGNGALARVRAAQFENDKHPTNCTQGNLSTHETFQKPPPEHPENKQKPHHLCGLLRVALSRQTITPRLLRRLFMTLKNMTATLSLLIVCQRNFVLLKYTNYIFVPYGYIFI